MANDAFEEVVQAIDGDFTRRWLCDVPHKDQPFQIIRSEWNADYTLQIVEEIRLAAGGVTTSEEA